MDTGEKKKKKERKKKKKDRKFSFQSAPVMLGLGIIPVATTVQQE
jgi:hypothetical protein